MDDLRLQFRLEQHKRGIKPEDKATSKQTKRLKENNLEAKHYDLNEGNPEPKPSDSESKSAQISSLPKGFFDDAAKQVQVEEQLVKEQVKAGEDVDEKEWESFEKFANTVRTSGEVETSAENGQSEDPSKNEGKNKTAEETKMEEGSEVPKTEVDIEDLEEMDEYADRFINIVKKSLKQVPLTTTDTDQDNTSTNNSTSEMLQKLKEGANRQKHRALEEAIMAPW
mmetsp:Transcript_14294/g.16590  ORF Transcript_14294/g.16590 Transcript_14294/m.16590 type:complete len:225 (+) Transcript_14294:105-779(+)|eukprot:CAMPEP_0204823672 /NCGR_PEP_ID=MMETSP1346-20131115/1745_1 /ASSEMBLY_ACC=CAM_ASM_000771 /TAXON_ID=215587 /ORGANISM="Aplanochytrium stocchinoi, Strain GSBS06" /LENGTH=224 /DNA_ID=CAMNT_0051950423 /DNA_START=66 /DNA_END=740 /DNA_ORIENTATION=+